ncbi:MAG: MFS transporter [Phycisphaerales bacterium]|nr:MFS transporter [Phycisphaerales bacterium]|tara:strand:- start:3258 stop:4607 length:1350 start_codon:yes stop_codon:yes gene_type:complete
MATLPNPNPSKELQQGRWYRWLFWGIVALFFLYEFFIRVTPNVILPQLQEDLGGTPGSTATAMSTYLWIYAPMQLVVGLLLDKWGSKFIVSTAAMVCGVGCIIFSYAPDLVSAGLGRGLIGMGSAFAFVGAIYIATVWFPPKQLGMIAGITTAVGMIGEVIGQVPVADLVKEYTWRDVVLWSGVVGIGIGIFMMVVIPRRPSWFDERFKHDSTAKESPIRKLGMIFRNPQIWIIGSLSAILYLPLSVIAALWGTTYLEKTMDIGVKDASLCMSVLAIGWLIGCPLFGKTSDKYQNRKIPLLIGSIGGFITMSLFLLAEDMSLTTMLVLMFVMGFVTSSQTLAFAFAIEINPRSMAATAVSACNFLTMLAAAALQNAVGYILDAISSPGSGTKTSDSSVPYSDVTASDFMWAIAVMPALFVVSIFLCLLLKETHDQKSEDDDGQPAVRLH